MPKRTCWTWILCPRRQSSTWAQTLGQREMLLLSLSHLWGFRRGWKKCFCNYEFFSSYFLLPNEQTVFYESHRRGSNVSLTLDMCTPGCTEPYGYGAQLSPRDQSAQEYLRQGTHILTPAMLHTRAMDDQNLQAEFYVSAATTAFPPTLSRLTETHRKKTYTGTRTDAGSNAHTYTPIRAKHTRKLFHCLLVGEGWRDTSNFAYKNPQRIPVSARQRDIV